MAVVRGVNCCSGCILYRLWRLYEESIVVAGVFCVGCGGCTRSQCCNGCILYRLWRLYEESIVVAGVFCIGCGGCTRSQLL